VQQVAKCRYITTIYSTGFVHYLNTQLVYKNIGMLKGIYIQDYSSASKLQYKPIPS
jgi:hypothetical protein